MLLNQEQTEHLKYIASLTPEERCGCGWFSAKDCRVSCQHPNQAHALDTAFREGYTKGKQRERERCVKIIDRLRKTWGSAGPTDSKVIYARNALSAAVNDIIDNSRA